MSFKEGDVLRCAVDNEIVILGQPRKIFLNTYWPIISQNSFWICEDKVLNRWYYMDDGKDTPVILF